MIFKPPPGDPSERQVGRPGRKPQGIAGRVEAAAKARAPAPKGKGVVMILLGLAVVVALIWEFTGRGAASRAVRESVGDGRQPVAPRALDGAGETGTDTGSRASSTPALKVTTAEGQDLSLSPAAAAALLASAPAETAGDLRRQILESLVPPADGRGDPARRAFEIAAWFAPDAGPEAAAAVSKITLRAYKALGDDRAAPAAILFLAGLPDRGGTVAATALDEVILDRKRPLHVRIAAAKARGETGRPARVVALETDQATHPALRKALGK